MTFKKACSIALLSAFVATGTYAAPAAAADATQVYVEDQLLATKQPVLNINDRTMMGFRDFFTALSTDVVWDDTTRRATTTYQDKTLVIDPDHNRLMLNGQTVTLDVPPQIIDGHIYLPLRYFGDTLGYQVDYTRDTNGTHVVRLNKEDATISTLNGMTVITTENAAFNNADRYALDGDRLIALSSSDATLTQTALNLNTHVISAEDTALADGMTLKAPRLNADGSIVLADNIQPVQDGYLGVGTIQDELRALYTKKNAAMAVRTAEGTQAELTLKNGTLDTVTETVAGHRIDISDQRLADDQVASVVPSTGRQAYLLDGHLMITDMTASETPTDKRVIYDENFGGQYLTAIGETIYTYGFANNNLYLGRMNTDTFAYAGYHRVYAFPSGDDYTVSDVAQANGKAIFLARYLMGAQAVQVDLATGTATAVNLPRQITFDTLVPNTDGSFSALAKENGTVYVYSLNKLNA